MTRITCENDIQLALNELKQLDPLLSPLMENVDNVPLRLSTSGYHGMAKIITSQLISRQAADAIWGRIESHFKHISPDAILTSNEEILRDLGLTKAKANTLIRLAEQLALESDFLSVCADLDAPEALKHITRIKGIGPWTAEVYLMFCEGHPDVFPSGDIALRNIAGKLFFNQTRPDEKRLRTYAERWQPWRSVAARLLWHIYGLEKNHDLNPV